MDSFKPYKQDWYVVFADSGYKSTVLGWLRPGFKHCYAMRKTEGGNFWQIVNPRNTHLEIRQELVSEYPYVRMYTGPDAVVLPVTAIIDTSRVRGHLCVFNCVEVVKSLLGIRSFWTWTPWMLCKYLMRADHE